MKGKKRQAKLDCFIAALIKKYKVVRGTFFYPQVKEDCEKQQREGTWDSERRKGNLIPNYLAVKGLGTRHEERQSQKQG